VWSTRSTQKSGILVFRFHISLYHCRLEVHGQVESCSVPMPHTSRLRSFGEFQHGCNCYFHRCRALVSIHAFSDSKNLKYLHVSKCAALKRIRLGACSSLETIVVAGTKILSLDWIEELDFLKVFELYSDTPETITNFIKPRSPRVFVTNHMCSDAGDCY